mmetsp:Transcript_49393/g.92595  ORF Transcript_49393/g.92595 Transcript_49393/m.92595 type:complete len:184 (-) Transcript_49393:75-626(-)
MPVDAMLPRVQRASTTRPRTRSSGDNEFYDDFAVGWNELFEEPAPGAAQARKDSQTPGELLPPPVVAKRKKLPPPYLRMGGGKKNAIERGIKERLRFCPINQIRKPAEIVDRELDQLRTQLGAEHGRRRQETRQMRRLRRRCRLQPNEDLAAVEERFLPEGKLQPIDNRSARTPRPDRPALPC